jgi:hypothetical protein
VNETVARRVLDDEIGLLQAQSYGELRDQLLRSVVTKEVLGPDGATYQIEIQAYWDDRPDGDLNVMVSVDDGRGWRVFVPLTDGFVISPPGLSVDA